jgi:hypothetical protein
MDNREARIRQKAHEIWEQAGRPANKADEHWSEAERRIDQEPNPRQQAVDIAPGPGGRDIHPIPAAKPGRG